MSFINPLRSGVSSTGETKSAAGMPRSKAAAERVKEVPFSQIQEANRLVKSIEKEWDLLDPEELAGKIVDLEQKVTRLEGSSPEVQRVQGKVEKVLFQFVFPIAAELKERSGPLMPPTFAQEVYTAAEQVEKGSLAPFSALNPIQQAEIQRQLKRGE